MDSKEMRLPQLDEPVLMSNAVLRREWVMDPPPWIVQKLRPSVVEGIYRVKMKRLAEVAKIEIQMKEIEAKMYGDIAKLMQGKR
jgi:hypothetical protein